MHIFHDTMAMNFLLEPDAKAEKQLSEYFVAEFRQISFNGDFEKFAYLIYPMKDNTLRNEEGPARAIKKVIGSIARCDNFVARLIAPTMWDAPARLLRREKIRLVPAMEKYAAECRVKVFDMFAEFAKSDGGNFSMLYTNKPILVGMRQITAGSFLDEGRVRDLLALNQARIAAGGSIRSKKRVPNSQTASRIRKAFRG